MFVKSCAVDVDSERTVDSAMPDVILISHYCSAAVCVIRAGFWIMAVPHLSNYMYKSMAPMKTKEIK